VKNLPNTVKVEGTSFIRELNSMGLSNVDTNSRNEYYSKVRMLNTQKNEINTIKFQMNTMESDMHEIKNLLSKLLGKGTNG